MMARAGIWTILAVALPVYVSVAVLVNRVVPEPYMDEIFHVPQAQQYCRGDFVTWDPMITTLPGLYYASLGYASALLPLFRAAGLNWTLSDLCSVSVLRSTNIALALACLVLFWMITKELEPSDPANHSPWMKTALMGLYPLHFFFTFLFYTDVGSTAAVLAMYLASLRRRHLACALCAAMAIYFRQTNAVWALFTLCEATMDLLSYPPIRAQHRTWESIGQGEKSQRRSMDPSLGPRMEERDEVERDKLKGDKSERDETQRDESQRDNPVDSKAKLGSGVRQRKAGSIAPGEGSVGGSVEKSECQVASAAELADADSEGVVFGLWHLAWAAWRDRWRVLVRMGPLMAVCAAFVVFVVRNGGIVLGAKDAHKMAPHFAHPLYFCAVAAAALFPFHGTPPRASLLGRQLAGSLRRTPVKTAVTTAFALAAALLAVHKYSLAHPYLLADNRHYPFYIWKNVIGRHWSVKYLLVPGYLYCASSILATLRERRPPLWIFFFCMATAGVLVPAPLIEFRYFTIPFLLALLHTPVPRGVGSWSLLCAYAVVNAATLYLFLFRTFEWPHEEGTQRFMW